MTTETTGDEPTAIRRRIIANMVLIGIGALLIGALVWNAVRSPTGATVGAAPLALARNAFLTTLPRESRDAWQGYFDDTSRVAQIQRIRGAGVDANVLGVNTDARGLIWSPAQHAGHYMRSGRPTDGTNIVVVGHSGEGLVFAPLVDVAVDDVLTLTTTDDREHRYRVVEREIVPVAEADESALRSYVDMIMPTDDEQLTLITCFPADDYSQRLIVRAVPEDD